jgi:glycosyltransferase involved in cell wall biosynthesis
MQMVFVEHRLLENFIRLNPFRGWYVKNCQRARVVAVSEAVKRGVVEFGVPAEQVQVIYNGIDLAEFRLPLKSRRENQGLVVGTISRLSADKGLDLLIAAVKRLGLKFPGLKVEIVGAGPERKKLERLTYNQGRPLPVCLRGGLGRAAIVEFLQNLDVFTLTPIHGESFGLVLAEAGAAGKPSVVTDVGGVAEVVKDGETGIVVPPGDVGALAEAIRRLLGNVDLRKRMGRAARRRVERMFTLDKMLNRYEQLLRNV